VPSAKSDAAVKTIAPIRRASGTVALPGSKSISNRALLLAAASGGATTLRGLLDADDTRVMIAALQTLGVTIVTSKDGTVVQGCGGRFPNASAKLFLGNAGTAMRPLAAALAFAGGHYELDGVARMRERPIGDLVDALSALGARIRYLADTGYPPLAIAPAAPLGSDVVEIKGNVSSQFVSALLMAGPQIAPAGGLHIRVPGALVSQPYVDLTLKLMSRFGIDVERGDQMFHVLPGKYVSPGTFVVEGDASGASYFLGLGVITGGPVRVIGVGRNSVQGDIGFARVLEAAGGRITWGDEWIEASSNGELRAFDVDCTDIPDAAMTGAIVASFARGRSVLRGIGSWRVKETDRIAAMATELRKLGAKVEEGLDWLAVEGPVAWREAEIDTYDDHRIAMCFSLTAAGGLPVHIRDPGCVAKTFPDYFDRLATLRTDGAT
jgi:3-phosphoshikimate 1-carboxyvinyltransferase